MTTDIQAERKRKKVEQAISTVRGSSGEPTINSESYSTDIAKALNWYNVNEEYKTIRKYAMTYIKHLKRHDLIYAFNQASDFELRQIGIIGRLVLREQYVSSEHISRINAKMDVLKDKYAREQETKKTESSKKPEGVVVSVQERIQEVAFKHAGEIDEHIDEFVKNKSSEFSTKSYLLSNAVSGAVAKRIGEYFQPLERELAEAVAGKDEQLNEGYSSFTKVQLKRFHEFVKGIIADCNQQVVSVKSARMPRKRKPIPPTKLVQKLKYLKEFVELNLKSVSPTDIVGASELWVYNTKYRKLTVYKGDLSVKGTTIIGYEIAGSDTKIIRKPEEYFKGLQIGKRPLAAAFKTIKAKPSTPNGRINADCILIGAFK